MLNRLFALFRRRGERLRDERPLIAGITHTPIRKKEQRRVEKLLESLPKGTRIGVELLPSRVEDLKKGGEVKSLSSFAAKKALELGYGVVGLGHVDDLELGNTPAPRVFQLPTYAGKTYISAAADMSIRMAKKILDQRISVAIMGDTHARDLRVALDETHRFDFTRVRYINWREMRELESFKREIDVRIREELAAHLKRFLIPEKK